MRLLEVPLGSEIALALLAVIAAVLTYIAQRIIRGGGEHAGHLPSDQVRVDLAPIIASIEASEAAIRQDLARIGRQANERLEQHDRHVAQLFQSLSDNISRQHREKELEDRRQFERLMDRIDRKGH